MTNFKRNALVPTAFAFVAFAAFADGGEVTLHVVYPTEEPQAIERTCEEAANDAVFLRELAKTDGNVEPDTPPIPQCNEQDAKA